MISLHDYYMGRDLSHADELTDEVMANARVTVERVNDLLARAGRSDITTVRSGWRPSGVNADTANSATHSKHITGQACDLPDDDRTLAGWIADNLDELEAMGLWAEDFRWTPTWVHVQTVPPKSGKLVYIPSTAKPLDPDFPVTWA